jgi:hypothetical protein
MLKGVLMMDVVASVVIIQNLKKIWYYKSSDQSKQRA